MAKLLCILEHPTQYDPPLWAALQRRGVLDPVVAYLDAKAPVDEEAQASVSWAQPTVHAAAAGRPGIGRLIDSLDERPICCIVPGWTKAVTWRALFECRRRGIPVILPSDKSLHEPVPRWTLAATVFHAVRSRLFQGFLTTGRLGWAALRSVGIPESRIAAGLYPVDCDWWARQVRVQVEQSSRIRAQMGGSVVVLAVSKWSVREDPLTIVRAFAEMSQKMPGARLLLVGDGPLRGAVRADLDRLGVSESAMLCGYVPYTTLPIYYGAADVFIHVPATEPWGISVSEAMACGLPVVASTTVGAAADLVVPGRTGALVSPGDVTGAADALVTVAAMAKQEQVRQAVVQAARRVDVEAASAAVERLVAGIGGAEPFEPLWSIVDSELRNHWGRWPA